MAILNELGDSKIKWDINSDESTKKAQKEFDDYKKKGYMFFNVDAEGNQKGEIKKFDPLAETIICIPAVKKG